MAQNNNPNNGGRMAMPVFHGECYDPMSARAFLADFETYCRTYAIDDDDKVTTLQTALRGEARGWYLQHENITETPTWDNTKKFFLRYWTAPVPRVNRGQMVANCKQYQGENVRNFLTRCCNLAFETLFPPNPTSLPNNIRGQVQNGNAAAFEATIPWTADFLKPVHAFYAKEKAMDIFIAGCLPPLKHHLALNKTWSTWDELLDVAMAVEATVMPHLISKQVGQFSGGQNQRQVNAVSDGQTTSAQQQMEVAPVSHKGGVRPWQTSKPASNNSTGTKPKSKPKASPHPQQHNTHSQPVTCYYCGGKFHTERHCLAKHGNKATAPVAAAAPAPPATTAPPQQPTFAQPQQQQVFAPQQLQQFQQFPQDGFGNCTQQAQIGMASVAYPNPHF